MCPPKLILYFFPFITKACHALLKCTKYYMVWVNLCHLKMLSVVKLILWQWYMCECVWCTGGMIQTGKSKVLGENNISQCHFFYHKSLMHWCEDQTQVSIIRDQWLTTHTMAIPLTWKSKLSYCVMLTIVIFLPLCVHTAILQNGI